MALPKKPLRLYTLSAYGYGGSGVAETDSPGVAVSLVRFEEDWNNFLMLEQASQAGRMDGDARNPPPPSLPR